MVTALRETNTQSMNSYERRNVCQFKRTVWHNGNEIGTITPKISLWRSQPHFASNSCANNNYPSWRGWAEYHDSSTNFSILSLIFCVAFFALGMTYLSVSVTSIVSPSLVPYLNVIKSGCLLFEVILTTEVRWCLFWMNAKPSLLGISRKINIWTSVRRM